MAVRRVFVVSSVGLTAYHRYSSKLLASFSFDADEEGLARFERYLERCPNDVSRIIADVVEEEFREETVPHAFFWDRRGLIRARAARVFPGVRYLHAGWLGRERSGRRDDRVRLGAITRPEVLAPWLAPIARHATPLAGIYSPAMLTEAMLKAIEPGSEHVLVVSLQCGGGLRQTCFRHGKLRFSRLAAAPDPAQDGFASDLLAEIDRTRRYLSTLQTGMRVHRLDVHVLSHGEPLDALRRELRRDADTGSQAALSLVDLAAVARKLGMRRWGGEPTADRLFVHLLALRPPRNHYATPQETRDFATLRARWLLKTASAGLVAGGCLVGAVSLLEGVVTAGHSRSLALQSMIYEARYREASTSLPPAPAEPAELERVVSAVNVLRGRRADPVDVPALVSGVLAGFPDVRIEGIVWRVSDDAEASADSQEDVPAGAESRGGVSLRDPGLLFQVARVSARIEPFDGDYRAAIDTVRRFAAALAAPPGVEHVRILALPLELGSEHALSGDADAPSEAAEFEVRVVRRVAVSGVAEV